jgi:hypothetical protein
MYERTETIVVMEDESGMWKDITPSALAPLTYPLYEF